MTTSTSRLGFFTKTARRAWSAAEEEKLGCATCGCRWRPRMVSGSTGVDPPMRGHDLAERGAEQVDVLVAVLDLEGVGGRRRQAAANTVVELVALGVGNPAAGPRAADGRAPRGGRGPRVRRAAVRREERLVELLHQRVDVLAEAATAPAASSSPRAGDHRGAATGAGSDASDVVLGRAGADDVDADRPIPSRA